MVRGWLSAIKMCVFPLLVIHLCISVVQLIILSWLLYHESRRKPRSIQDRMASPGITPSPSPSLQRIMNLRDLEERKQWSRYWNYTFVWLIFHVGYDLFSMIQFDSLFGSWDDSQWIVSNSLLVFYVLSLTFRTTGGVLSVPPLCDILFGYHSKKIKNFDALSMESGWRMVIYFLFLALESLPSTVSVLFNAAMYFGLNATCSSLLGCIFTWDHWYMMVYLWSVIRFNLIRVFNVSKLHHWILVVGLFVLSLFCLVAPFVFQPEIVRLTFLCNLYYETMVLSESLHLLRQRYIPDDDEDLL